MYLKKRYVPTWKKEHYAATDDVFDFVASVIERLEREGKAINVLYSRNARMKRVDF